MASGSKKRVAKQSASPSEAASNREREAGEFPADFVRRAEAVIRELEGWGDTVIEAWLDRRTGQYEWWSPDDEIWIECNVRLDGRSIFSTYHGDCLVTRAKDGFIAIVSGRHYRDRWGSLQLEVLEHALSRREVPGKVVRPPHAVGQISAELLERWWTGAKQWQRLSDEAAADRLIVVARNLVAALLETTDTYVYSDGYYHAEASSHAIYAWDECLAVRAPEGPWPVILSGRRYRRSGLAHRLRLAMRVALIEYGVAFREMHPGRPGPSSPRLLLNAGRAASPRLVKCDEPHQAAPRGRS